MEHQVKEKLFNIKLKTAGIISRIAEPLFWLPFMIWLVMRRSDLPVGEQVVYYLVLLVFVFLIPFCYFMYLVLVKKEIDLDITVRSKRIGLTVRSMFSFAVAPIITYFIDREVFVITMGVFFSTLSLVLVTLRWKISFHTGLNTLIFCTVNFMYNWRFWWLFLLLLPIGWARLEMRKHNLAQAAAGAVLSFLVFVFVTTII